MLDTSSKRKRRIERDKEIDAVKAEIQELQDEETRLLAELSLRRRPSRPQFTFLQKRHHSTAASPLSSPRAYDDYPTDLQQTTELSAVSDVRLPEATGQIEPEPPEEENASGYYIGWKGEGPEPEDSAERRKAIQYLAIKRLALRLLLRPVIAHTYESVYFDYPYDKNFPNMEVQPLLDAIDLSRRRINNINHNKNAHFIDLIRHTTPGERKRVLMERHLLENDLKTLFGLQKDGQISLRELLVRVADNLVAIEYPIFASTVALLILGFSKAGQDDVVSLVIDTLFPSRFYLSSTAIGHAINFYARTKNLARFDRLIGQLSEGRALLNNRPWKIEHFDRIQVPVPPKPVNPYLANCLIKAALTFNQDQRARVWSKYFKDAGLEPNHHTITMYLQHYAKTAHWIKGVHFLWDAVRYLARTKAEDLTGYTERLILHMMTLCNSCGNDYLLHKMIKLAVRHGIDYNLMELEVGWELIDDTLELWKTIDADKHDMSATPLPEGKTAYAAFADDLKGLIGREVKACRKEGQRIRQAISKAKVDENSQPRSHDTRDHPHPNGERLYPVTYRQDVVDIAPSQHEIPSSGRLESSTVASLNVCEKTLKDEVKPQNNTKAVRTDQGVQQVTTGHPASQMKISYREMHSSSTTTSSTDPNVDVSTGPSEHSNNIRREKQDKNKIGTKATDSTESSPHDIELEVQPKVYYARNVSWNASKLPSDDQKKKRKPKGTQSPGERPV